MMTMNKTAATMCGVTLLVCVGCGASAMDGHLSTNPALRTDGDRYSAAILDATEAYEAEVAQVATLWYPTAVDASSTADAHSDARFHQLLRDSLHERGLTARGLAVYESHHPEFRQQLARLDVDRLRPARETAAAVARRVLPEATFSVAVLDDGFDTDR